ncbi:MAG: SMC-Scp complex subunit ScpB [Gammaproteobacteria bacterium]
MDHKTIKNVVEASMFAAGRPMSMNELLRLFSEDERPERKVMKELLDELRKEYDDRGIELVEVASGFRIQVRHHMGEWLGRLSERRAPRYSRALMETLALIAYRQPITRGDIEDVRGVSVSTNIIRTLLERGWVRIVGHRDVPGRPAMFGTSKDFLDYFNLKSLDELPSLAELKDIDSMNTELDFGTPPYEDGGEVNDLQTADGGDTRAEFEEEFGEDLTIEGEELVDGNEAAEDSESRNVEDGDEESLDSDEDQDDDEADQDDDEDDLEVRSEDEDEDDGLEERSEDDDEDDEDDDDEQDDSEERSEDADDGQDGVDEDQERHTEASDSDEDFDDNDLDELDSLDDDEESGSADEPKTQSA